MAQKVAFSAPFETQAPDQWPFPTGRQVTHTAMRVLYVCPELPVFLRQIIHSHKVFSFQKQDDHG
jgi:hypothetical protein